MHPVNRANLRGTDSAIGGLNFETSYFGDQIQKGLFYYSWMNRKAMAESCEKKHRLLVHPAVFITYYPYQLCLIADC